MKYEIDTTWKENRREEIEELNRICGDERMVELDIHRKLAILSSCREAMENEIEGFNFNVVIEFMRSKNWCWHRHGKMIVPTKQDFIDTFNDWLKTALYGFIEHGNKSYQVESGGIVFRISIDNLEFPCPRDVSCRIWFDISQWTDANTCESDW